MQMDLSMLITVCGLVLSVATFFIGRASAIRKDGQSDGQILTELGYLKSNTDAIMKRLDKQDERDREYVERLAAVESSAKQAHKRLDEYGIGRAGKE